MTWQNIIKNDFGGGRYENKKMEYPHQLHNYTSMFASDMDDYMKILKQFMDSKETLVWSSQLGAVPRSKKFDRVAKEIYTVLDKIDLYAYTDELQDELDSEEVVREGRR